MKSLSLTNVALMEQPSGDVLVTFYSQSFFGRKESEPFRITKSEMQQIVKEFSDEQRNH